jgi:hypothetical protein
MPHNLKFPTIYQLTTRATSSSMEISNATTGEGIFYFVRDDNSGTDVVIARSFDAAVALHRSVASVPGQAYWAAGPLSAVIESSPAIRAARTGRVGRPRKVKSEAEWYRIPPGAGIYRIKQFGSDPALPPETVYIGCSGDFKVRPRHHEKIPRDQIGRQLFGGPHGIDQIELLYAVADGPDMWHSRTLDEMEAEHINRAAKKHQKDPSNHPRVVNVTTGRNGPPSNPRAHIFLWPTSEDSVVPL